MDTKKLNKWAESLLDTGKGNNLISFKDRKASSAEVLLPASDKLFKMIEGTSSFEVFDPQIIENDNEEKDETEQSEAAFPDNTSDKKEAYIADYSRKIKRQNQLLLYNTASDPLTAVKNINKKAREFIEETGVNVAYMAFGFINWRENDSSDMTFRAPVLLVPIQLEQASAAEPYHISSTEDEIIVNPTFSYKLKAEYNIELPDYSDEGLNEYLEEIRNRVSGLKWTVTPECKIGIFSFLKINMYRDLKDNEPLILANKNVRQLMGEPVEAGEMNETCETDIHVADPLIELHSIVDADSSQIEAIEMAKSGKSFVLQGPPGTGKSQTISNIIAECISDGKKVLFVSEKLAALNVVYDKLKLSGLSEFCLELHSHKANKKDVITDICRTLNAGKITVSSKANNVIEEKKKTKRQLDSYAFELHKQRPKINKSLFQLYEEYSALRYVPYVECQIPELLSKGEDDLEKTVSLLEQYAAYIPYVGYDYRKNPWYGYINQDTSSRAKTEVENNFICAVEFLQDIIPLQKEISEKYQISCNSLDAANKWRAFFDFAAKSDLLTPALLNRDTFEKVKTVSKILQSCSSDILSLRSELDDIFDDDIYKIDGSEYHKKLTRQYTGAFSRLFNSEYNQIVSELRLCKKDGKKLSYNEAVEMTELLSDYQEKAAEYLDAETSVKAFLGPAYKGIKTDWNRFSEQILELEIISSGISFGNLKTYQSFDAERDVFADFSQQFENVFAFYDEEMFQQIFRCFDRSVLNVFLSPCHLLLTKLDDCRCEMDKLENWCQFRNLLSELNTMRGIPYLNTAISCNVEQKYIAEAYRKTFCYQWIEQIISETPVLSMFSRISQDNAKCVFSEKDKEQFEINKSLIRAELSAKRPGLEMIVQGSPASVLLREGEKKRRLKSIRTLLSETGEFVQLIKPCFLMSPLSVSTFLVPEAVHFDTVIFDEASQIFVQDAIGAIYRADQLIVVGDSKQMPPSDFFNASVEIDDNDEEVGDVADFESVLDLCSASMPQLRLRWHYRSRYEQLIAFSNKNFYDNDLITFPSSKIDAEGIGVDYYHVDSVFDRKSHTNRKEAEYIVDLIYRNIEEHSERSLGVVAFSVAQQDLIDKLLMKRRQAIPEKEFFFKNDVKEPFFIKNLETVQGDERDTIIFSIAYGIDAQGRLLHNFGPLNRVGGERRLNVAVTRAKHNVQLVSSMHYSDIDLQRSSADGTRLLREYLDYAENGSTALERTIITNPFDQYDSDFELEVCEFLRDNGFSVDTQVGCSGFKIDLGLKRPDSSDYVLAIECDGASYHSSKNARDRDRLRQEILESMGWKFYRIWSTDWFRNKSVEQDRLLNAAAAAINDRSKAVVRTTENRPAESFEEVASDNHFEFPVYKAADIDILWHQYLPADFKGFIKAVLEVEAPLSEELLLKRIAGFFDREKVTSVVQREYAQRMRGYSASGIIRKNGFLYLDDNGETKEIVFRVPGDIKREIKQIAPEELAAGMLEIIKQNVSVDKGALYSSLAALCGVTRVGDKINETFDEALEYLKKTEQIKINDEQVSLN